MIPLGPLYHYTCGHQAPIIRRDGFLRSGHDLGGRSEIPWNQFVWLTDMAVPARDALGLTSEILTCDRTEYRFRVTYAPAGLVSWLNIRREYRWAEYLEWAPGARPAHWWVSPVPVPVVESP